MLAFNYHMFTFDLHKEETASFQIRESGAD